MLCAPIAARITNRLAARNGSSDGLLIPVAISSCAVVVATTEMNYARNVDGVVLFILRCVERLKELGVDVAIEVGERIVPHGDEVHPAVGCIPDRRLLVGRVLGALERRVLDGKLVGRVVVPEPTEANAQLIAKDGASDRRDAALPTDARPMHRADPREGAALIGVGLAVANVASCLDRVAHMHRLVVVVD